MGIKKAFTVVFAIPAIILLTSFSITALGPKGSVEILLSIGSWISSLLPKSIVESVSFQLNSASPALGYIQFVSYLSFVAWMVIGYSVVWAFFLWKRFRTKRHA